MASLDLSIVVVTAGTFGNLRRTVRHLREQSEASRIELLIVSASEEMMLDLQPGEIEGFARTEFVYTGAPIRNVDQAASFGVHRAGAPVVALIEDHAYPCPDWARHILQAHQQDWGVVGSTVLNANPRSAVSWTNLLIAYGPWTEPNIGGEQEALPGHNITYKTHLLKAYGGKLIDRMGRAGGLIEDLQANGERLYLESNARLAHANPSRIRPTLQLRFNAGRLYGHTRAIENDWTPLHIFLYLAGGLLIPFIRFARFRSDFFGFGKRAELVPRVLPMLWVGLLLDALGQMAGYAFGPGKSVEVLSVFEMDRRQHLNRHDRHLLSTDAVDEATPPSRDRKAKTKLS